MKYLNIILIVIIAAIAIIGCDVTVTESTDNKKQTTTTTDSGVALVASELEKSLISLIKYSDDTQVTTTDITENKTILLATKVPNPQPQDAALTALRKNLGADVDKIGIYWEEDKATPDTDVGNKFADVVANDTLNDANGFPNKVVVGTKPAANEANTVITLIATVFKHTDNFTTMPTQTQLAAAAATDKKAVRLSLTLKRALATTKALTKFAVTVNGRDIGGTITEATKQVALTIPLGVTKTALAIKPTHNGASAKLGADTITSGTTTADFSKDVIITIVAADSSTQDYTVTTTDDTNLFEKSYGGKRYQIDKRAATWANAAAAAVTAGGKLVHIETQGEQTNIETLIAAATAVAGFMPGSVPGDTDAGGIAHIWIGATDSVTEKTWTWDGDGTTTGDAGVQFGTAGDLNPIDNSIPWTATNNLYQNWGIEFNIHQRHPDNGGLNGQHYGAIVLDGAWRTGEQYQWNDISGVDTNTLPFIIEFP